MLYAEYKSLNGSSTGKKEKSASAIKEMCFAEGHGSSSGKGCLQLVEIPTTRGVLFLPRSLPRCNCVDIAGNHIHHTLHPAVPVECHSQFNMLSSVPDNEVRNTTKLMAEICYDVCIKLHLPPLTGEALDIALAITTVMVQDWIWHWDGQRGTAFFNIIIFNPLTQSNSDQSPTAREHQEAGI